MSPFTSKHPDAIGAGSLSAAFTQRLDIATDADSPDCLYITYDPDIAPGMVPAVTPHAATVAVATAGAGTQARITLAVKNHNAVGAANADVTFTIDCDGAYAAWASNAGVASSLKDIIDLINADDAGGTSGKLLQGFRASIGPGGMYDLWCRGASMFQAEAAEYILPAGTTGTPTGILKRDLAVAGSAASDGDYFSLWRIGFPEVQDRGLFKILDLYGTISADTGDQVSDMAGIMVIRDDVADYVAPTNVWATDIVNHEFVYHVDRDNFPADANTAAGGFIHNPVEAPTVRGPVVVVIKHDTDYDTNVAHIIAQIQAVS